MVPDTAVVLGSIVEADHPGNSTIRSDIHSVVVGMIAHNMDVRSSPANQSNVLFQLCHGSFHVVRHGRANNSSYCLTVQVAALDADIHPIDDGHSMAPAEMN